MSEHDAKHERLAELLAGAQLQDLTHDELMELEELLRQYPDHGTPELLGELIVMLDDLDTEKEELPPALAERLTAGGRAAIASSSSHPDDRIPIGTTGGGTHRNLMGWLTGIAALVAIGTGIFAYTTLNAHRATQQQYRQEVESLQAKIEENSQLLARSRIAAADAQDQLGALGIELDEATQLLAQTERDKLELAQRLADATTQLQDAELRIAKYETPEDPEVLAERRTRLLDVPDTIQIAWQPFNLPDSPAEQPNVRGDVVWSDELQQGYIRFVGLNPNDPNIEQYQVWVIDERGMEQKVSGGVFNASAEGEIIVPIEPGIDVGRVALFAVTVENPGGTWVPDLSRRVVVAPRDG